MSTMLRTILHYWFLMRQVQKKAGQSSQSKQIDLEIQIGHPTQQI